MSKGAPGEDHADPGATCPTSESFRRFEYGTGAAIAFILFLIIVVLTLVQRLADGRGPGHRTAHPAGGQGVAVRSTRAGRQAGREHATGRR